MKMTCKRLIALLTVLSLIFIGYPVNAAEDIPTDQLTEQMQFVSACRSQDEIYCDFSIDVNTVHRYTDSLIPFEFSILGLDDTDAITINVSSSIEIEHNIPVSQEYTKENNEVSLVVNVLEDAIIQSLENLIFEHISVELVNCDEEIVFTINVSVINTEHPLLLLLP